jgi:hypothetical protein
MFFTGVLAGCGSTPCVASKQGLHQFDGGTQPVYVANPGMQPEYNILKASGIYPLSTTPDGARRLTLLPIRYGGRCANPLMLTIITLGIVPGVLPDARFFAYDLDTDGVVERRIHYLPIYDRISIWEHLVRYDDQRVLAEGLAWSKLEPLTASQSMPVPK